MERGKCDICHRGYTSRGNKIQVESAKFFSVFPNSLELLDKTNISLCDQHWDELANTL